jgi:hypothetical protein
MQVIIEVRDAAEEQPGEVQSLVISVKCRRPETSVAKWRHVLVTRQKAVIS